MYLYFALAAIAGVVAGIVIAARSKKAEGVVYGTLDKIGIATNILLIPIYFILCTYFFFLVMLGMNPDGEGLLLVVSVIVSVIGATGPAFCGIGLGASVALRKKGKSVQSFLAQFAGIAGLATTFLFFVIFYTTLFASLN